MNTTEVATTPAADADTSKPEVAATVPAPAAEDQDHVESDYMPDPDAEADDTDDAELSDEEKEAKAAAATPPTDTQAEPAEEMVEVEYAPGKKASIPKELQRGFLRMDDYTRKTQEVSAAGKEVVARAEALAASEEVGKALVAEHAAVHSLEARVQQYEQMTQDQWIELHEDDPDKYQRHRLAFETATRDLATARTTLETKTNARLTDQRKATEAARVTARQETGKALRQEIEGFDGKVAEEIIQHGMAKFGIEADEFADMTDVRPWKVLHENLQLTKAGASKDKRIAELEAALTNKTTADTHAAAGAGTPAARTRGAAPQTGPSDQQKTEGWMERRNREVAARKR